MQCYAGHQPAPGAAQLASIVKAGALKLGFDPATFGGHSLRAGFVTSAVKRGANLIKSRMSPGIVRSKC